MTSRLLLLLLSTALLAAVPGCAHRKVVADPAPSLRGPDREPTPAGVPTQENRIEITSGSLVDEQACGCSLELPEGWRAWRVSVYGEAWVRLERDIPSPMIVEIGRSTDRVPDSGEGFFDRGPYMGEGLEDQVVTVWSSAEPLPPGVRHFGVLLGRNGRSLVVEGWLPEEDFEGSKRAFDGFLRKVTLSDGESP